MALTWLDRAGRTKFSSWNMRVGYRDFCVSKTFLLGSKVNWSNITDNVYYLSSITRKFLQKHISNWNISSFSVNMKKPIDKYLYIESLFENYIENSRSQLYTESEIFFLMFCYFSILLYSNFVISHWNTFTTRIYMHFPLITARLWKY